MPGIESLVRFLRPSVSGFKGMKLRKIEQLNCFYACKILVVCFISLWVFFVGSDYPLLIVQSHESEDAHPRPR